MGCPFVIPPHPVCGRGTKPRGRLRVGLSPIPDAEPLTFCCERRRGLASPEDKPWGGDLPIPPFWPSAPALRCFSCFG
jgi:hypothetical protein